MSSADSSGRSGAPSQGNEAGDATPGAPAIALDELTRRFGETTAVDALSFEVRRGELFGLVGPDGAGKTTTLRMLAGVLSVSAGDATVLGTSVVREPERVKPNLAYMPQRFGLYEDLTVRENLDFYADLFRVPRADRPSRIARLHEFSGLGEFEDRLAGALSGGMKQKLALSCALVHRPAILLLDEPTFGVDPISRRDLWLILHEMIGEGVTVLVSTSYLDEAERCDRVALLDEGRLIALDRPARLQIELEGGLFAIRADDPRRARDVLRSSPGVRRATLFGRSIHLLVDPGETPDAALRRLAEAGITVTHSEPIEPSLEDVFIDRVARTRAHAS
ncbi:MAG: ABC transporter ATP-binding protein [Gemmatimonadetes bacterium]|nr:ABC transporter ATP-binding protein [Gemmatimonadota bacterium]